MSKIKKMLLLIGILLFALLLLLLSIKLFYYPVKLSDTDKTDIIEQLNIMNSGEDYMTSCHLSFRGMDRSIEPTRIYVFYTANVYTLDDNGTVRFDHDESTEMCIQAQRSGSKLIVKSVDTPKDNEEYGKSRKEMFPILIRITMGGRSAYRFRDSDLDLAKDYFNTHKNAQTLKTYK